MLRLPATARLVAVLSLAAARLAAVGFGLLAVMGVFGAVPASAHAELISSDPRDGAKLASSPGEVTLTFEENIDPKTARSRVEAKADDGFTYSVDPKPRVEGAEVVVPLGAVTAAGQYTVTYRVVSEDGHPVEGSIDFIVTEPVEAPVDPAATTDTSPEASTSPTADAATGSTAGPSATASATAPATTGVSDDGVNPVWLYALGGIAVLGAAGAAVALILRYRSP